MKSSFRSGETIREVPSLKIMHNLSKEAAGADRRELVGETEVILSIQYVFLRKYIVLTSNVFPQIMYLMPKNAIVSTTRSNSSVIDASQEKSIRKIGSMESMLTPYTTKMQPLTFDL